MNWIDVKYELPKLPGNYLVKRQWNDTVIATGQSYYDGMFWQPKIMDELAGHITHWCSDLVPEEVKKFI